MNLSRLSMFGALLLTACGNWSNSDLDFLTALPERTTLKSKIPGASSTTAPLSGVATRRDGLNVGEPSKGYADAKKASTDFNGILDGLLTILDTVRKYPPTARTKTSRVWGPYPDSKNVGFEFQVTIAQTDADTYGWKIESRPTGGAFFVLVEGAFKATASAKRGQGAMVVHVKDFKNRLNTDAGLKQLDQIDIGYLTDAFPHRVDMVFTFAPGNTSQLSRLGYTYREQQDASGAMGFLTETADPNVTSMETVSRWLPSGAGRSAGVVRSGNYAGASAQECWDSAFTVAFYKESWPGGVTSGKVTDCVEVPGL